MHPFECLFVVFVGVANYIPPRHLSDPIHRESYESAHSVILSIFASYSQRQQQLLAGNDASENNGVTGKQDIVGDPQFGTRIFSGLINTGGVIKKSGTESETLSKPEIDKSSSIFRFVERMVPFYANCLIDVSVLCLYILTFIFALLEPNRCFQLSILLLSVRNSLPRST